MLFVYKLKLESPTEGNTLIVFKYLNYSHLIEFLNYCRYNIYFDNTKKSRYSGLYNMLFILRWKSLENLNVTHFLSKTYDTSI